MAGSSDLDRQIEQLKRCEYINEVLSTVNPSECLLSAFGAFGGDFHRSIALPHWLPCSKQRTASGSQTSPLVCCVVVSIVV